MKRLFYLFIVSVLFVVGCKKNSPNGENSPEPLSFQIIEQKRTDPNLVSVTWSIPKGISSAADIKYAISLNGVPLDTIKNTVYVFKNILATKTYAGQITAIVNGASKKLDFTVNEEKAFIFTQASGVSLSLGNTFSCYTATGLFVWSKQIKSQSSWSGYFNLKATNVTASNDTLFVYDKYSSFTEGIYALDAKTGATFWHIPSSSGVPNSLVCSSGILLIERNGAFIALNPANGQKIWEKNFSGGSTSYTIYKGIFLMRSTPDRSDLIAYEAKSGKELWRYTTSSSNSNLGVPYVKDNKVYIINRIPNPVYDYYRPSVSSICVFDINTGTKQTTWNFKILLGGNDLVTKPLIIDDILYLSTVSDNLENDMLFAININTGKALWEKKVNYAWSGLFSDSVNLYVAGDLFTKVDKKTGNKIWTSAFNSFVVTPDNIYAIKSTFYQPQPIIAYHLSSGLEDASVTPNILSAGILFLRINDKYY